MGFNGAGVASFYGLAVVPAARRKGIGAAITLTPLLAARDAGYHHAVLFSTDEAVPLYERLGFRDCGVRIDRYFWRNPGREGGYPRQTAWGCTVLKEVLGHLTTNLQVRGSAW